MPLAQVKLNSDDLKFSRIIVIAINFGATLFAFVCFYLYLTNNILPQDNSISDILLLMLAIISISAYTLQIFIPKKVLFQTLKKNREELISAFNSYTIIRMAMLEGPVLFGLVILIITIKNGSIYIYDYYLLTIIPLIILYAISIITFPRVEKVNEILTEAIKAIEN